MEKTTFEAEYRYGKLYDKKTGKRILIAEDANVTIVVNNTDILDKDIFNHAFQTRSKEAIEEEIKEYKYYRYWLFASRGSLLRFQIKAGKTGRGKTKVINRNFNLRILSELYMVQKKENDIKGVVYPTTCVVESVEGGLANFEPIYAYSLNDAYMKTYDFYFALYGKPTTNIYSNFQLIEENNYVPLSSKRFHSAAVVQ